MRRKASRWAAALVCPHCGKPLVGVPVYTYPESRVQAHLACVSQPSARETDILLTLLAR